jgi:hypothetical protein
MTQPELHTEWSVADSCVLFEVRHGGRKVLCRIDGWVLYQSVDADAPSEKPAMAAFEANRVRLERLAIAKAERNEFEPDSVRPEGIIRLWAKDVR